jgi:hypothetical protein
MDGAGSRSAPLPIDDCQIAGLTIHRAIADPAIAAL